MGLDALSSDLNGSNSVLHLMILPMLHKHTSDTYQEWQASSVKATDYELVFVILWLIRLWLMANNINKLSQSCGSLELENRVVTYNLCEIIPAGLQFRLKHYYYYNQSYTRWPHIPQPIIYQHLSLPDPILTKCKKVLHVTLATFCKLDNSPARYMKKKFYPFCWKSEKSK